MVAVTVAASLFLAPLTAAEEGHATSFNPFEFAEGALIWTLLIFGLSLPVMWKFVFGPITKALAERDQAVVDAAKAADDAREKAEQAVATAREEREQARADGKRMVADATARAERQAQEAQKNAKVEAERLLAKAREDIEAEKRRALLEIRAEVVNLTIASTGRLLRSDVDDKAHRDMVSRFVGEVGGDAHGGGDN